MSTKLPRALSLIQPTASSLHLGNYLGALAQFAPLQDTYDTFYGVADLHSLTVQPDPGSLRANTLRTAAQLIASGVDPQKSPVFVQSHVPEHTQLMHVLSCLTGFGQANRMPQFKSKGDLAGGANVGLFSYPILMAADILLYKAETVPVGIDQLPHLELARDVARRFNSHYGATFPIPEPHMLARAGKIQDLRDPTVKMSKSSSTPKGLVELLDEPHVNTKKIRSATTDTDGQIRYDERTKPGISNLISIQAALTGEDVDTVVAAFEGQGYGHLKNAVADTVEAISRPFREKTLQLLDDRGELERVLAEGAERAREVASTTLTAVYDRIGLLPAP